MDGVLNVSVHIFRDDVLPHLLQAVGRPLDHSAHLFVCPFLLRVVPVDLVAEVLANEVHAGFQLLFCNVQLVEPVDRLVLYLGELAEPVLTQEYQERSSVIPFNLSCTFGLYTCKSMNAGSDSGIWETSSMYSSSYCLNMYWLLNRMFFLMNFKMFVLW